MKPVIAILGRPNVGKSTLFNRLTRSRNALVDNFPGVTRDRIYGDVKWNDMEFTIVDTGGFVTGDSDGFAPLIREQIESAVEEADCLVLVLDGRQGISPFDTDLVEQMRRSSKPALYLVNKIDGPELERNLVDFFELGIENPLPVSAQHGYGVNDLMDALTEMLPEQIEAAEPDVTKIAVVGRPNVGKSSLINRILGKNRLVVSNTPGTTRDAVDTLCTVAGKSYLFVDTAGIRRKGKVKRKIEKFSIIKALRSLDRCDIALVVIDASEDTVEQDMTIAGYAYERGRGCIFLLNKWDLIEKDTHTVRAYMDRLYEAAKFMPFAPAVTISAKTGQRVQKIFPYVDRVYEQYATRISTGKLNQILERAVQYNEPSLHRGRRIKIFYGTQVSAKPPTIICFVNYPEAVHFSYKRYLLNRIREESGLNQTPIRLYFRKREGRLDGKF